MTDYPLKHLSIRSGIVGRPDTGYILACDPKTEETDPHAKIFAWHRGDFSDSWVKFNAHSICRISVPEVALVLMSSEGLYAIYTKKGVAGNIFSDSQPKPPEPRYGSLRSLSVIADKAYAVGFRGMVYRLDELARWTRIDEGLSSEFDIQAIHGFDDSDIYAVGLAGEVWHFSGKQWTKCPLPTNVNLTCIKCANDGSAYIGGHDGILIRGRENTWSIIDNQETTDDVWDLEWFEGKLYVATMHGVFRFKDEELKPVDFGTDPPKSCYHLSAANGVMWSIGDKDVVAFDAKTWTRIV